MSPKHSISFCPICGGGLCGIRICGLTPNDSEEPSIHGLIVCDECEATWLEPDISSQHVYPDAVDSACPICSAAMWGDTSRWANSDDVKKLGWAQAINHDLDVIPDEGIA